jgi:hypothetical protein
VSAFAGFGQIPQAKVAPHLHRIEVVNRTGHGDSSFKRTSGERSSRLGGHLNGSRCLTRRSASRRPTPGQEARNSPCQHLRHRYKASVTADRTANEIAGARMRACTRSGLQRGMTYHRRTEQPDLRGGFGVSARPCSRTYQADIARRMVTLRN